MKKNRLRTGMIVWMGLVMLLGVAGTAAADRPVVPGDQAAYLENIAFEKANGKERVILTLSRQVGVVAEDQPGNVVLIKMDNLSVPQPLRRSLGEGALDNLIRATAEEKADGKRQQAVLRIELKQAVPYRIGQEKQGVVIDFNVASLPARAAAAVEKPVAAEPAAKPAAAAVKAKAPVPVKEKAIPKKPDYLTRPIYLNVQDASIASVLHLLAEEAGVSIVYGDDVKGNVTVSLKKTEWEKALDTVLDIKDLMRVQEGDIIRVISKAKYSDMKKKEEEEAKRSRLAAEEREKMEQQKRVLKGDLPQISIEAKIVEAKTTFARRLGVQWGGSYTGLASALKGTYPYGIGAGTTPYSSAGTYTTLPVGSGIGLTEVGNAVNLPTAMAGVPSIGVVIGSANAVLSAQLQAVEDTGEGKLISTPRVVVLDGEKAVINQGEQIPYITAGTATSPPTITWKDVYLKLEVTPKVTEDGRISMLIKATNDRAEKDQPVGGQYPIAKNEFDSRVVVNDGDTIVIGGVMKTEETKSTSGVPWINKVPILGWLFKTEDIDKTKSELLIFVTPKVFQKARAKAVS